MRFTGIIVIVLTVLAASLLGPATLAQDSPPTPAEIAKQCVKEMHAVSTASCVRMKSVAEFGIRRMRELNEKGAPDRVLHEVASETRERVLLIADEARDRINAITVRCVRHLRSIDAPSAAIEFVVGGRKHAIGVVRICAHRTTRIVWRAFGYLVRITDRSL